MNIYHFAKYSKQSTGGMETTLRLFENNETLYHHFFVYDKHISTDSFEDGSEIKCKVNFTFLNQPLSFDYFKNLFTTLRRRDSYVVLHMPNLQLLPFIKLIRLFNTKCILFWHADPISSKYTFVNWLLNKILLLLIGRDVTVITTSKMYRAGSYFLKYFKEDRLYVCNLCLENEVIKIHQRAHKASRKTKDSSGVKILAVGRLVKYKNLIQLVEAMAHLPNHFTLDIIGHGPEEKSLIEKINSLDLRSRVSLRGKQRIEVLINYYKEADVFCLPSNTRAEAFGLVLLEAAYFDLPLVVHGGVESGTMEIARDYGRYFEFIDLTSLARAIVDASNSLPGAPSRKQQFWNKYSIERFNGSFEEVIENAR